MDKNRVNALEYLSKKLGDYPEFEEGVQAAYIELEIAQMIYDARKEAGLTQKQLADRIGTTQSVISRLEDADYGGQSFAMILRIASALDMKLEMRFIPIIKKKRKSLQTT